MRACLTVLFILVLVAITSGCGTPPVDHTGIPDAYEEAIEAGDVDAALALFADDALVLTPWGYFRGKEEIRKFVEQELDFFLQGNPFGERLNGEQTENTLNYDERFQNAIGTTVQIHHAYVIENGKIKEWTMSGLSVE